MKLFSPLFALVLCCHNPACDADARASYNVPMRFATAMLALACATACLADTLTLRNGQVVQGTYMGGTERTIKMQVQDEVKTFDVVDVASLQFTAPAKPVAAERQ